MIVFMRGLTSHTSELTWTAGFMLRESCRLKLKILDRFDAKACWNVVGMSEFRAGNVHAIGNWNCVDPPVLTVAVGSRVTFKDKIWKNWKY